MQDEINLKSSFKKEKEFLLPDVLSLIILSAMLIWHSTDVGVNIFLCIVIVFISSNLN